MTGLTPRISISAGAAHTRTIRHRPTIARLERLDPLMAAGNWVPELIDLAGAAGLFGRHGQHSEWLDWEQLTAADPGIILIIPVVSESLERALKPPRSPPALNDRGLRPCATGASSSSTANNTSIDRDRRRIAMPGELFLRAHRYRLDFILNPQQCAPSIPQSKNQSTSGARRRHRPVYFLSCSFTMMRN